MFIAALLSLSCLVLHCEHIHCLIFVSCIYYYLSFFLIIFYIYRLLISFSSISPTFLSLLEYYIYNLSSTNSSPTCRSGSILGEFKINKKIYTMHIIYKIKKMLNKKLIKIKMQQKTAKLACAGFLYLKVCFFLNWIWKNFFYRYYIINSFFRVFYF